MCVYTCVCVCPYSRKRDLLDVNPEEECTCWHGFPVANWGQTFHKKGGPGSRLLAGLLCTVYATRKNLNTRSLHYVLRFNCLRPLFSELLVSSFHQQTETFPIQSELFINNQSAFIMLTNQDRTPWTNQNHMNLDTPFLKDGTNWEPGWELSGYKDGLPFISTEHTFHSCQRLCLPREMMQTAHLNKVSPWFWGVFFGYSIF